MAKGLTTRYLPGYRGWTKVRRRDTIEAIIGAITGTLPRPQLLVLGRLDTGGRLRAVGRTVPLRAEQSRQVAEHLAPAGSGHPFEGVRFTAAWGSRDVLDVVLVAQTWWRRSARIARWITAGCSATPCGTDACAWTWVWRKCRGPGWDRGPRRGDRAYGCSWLSGLFGE
ncbi:hypothetical protein [Streptomyces sp. enrichment culture]|uniref:hypothetical protein n=1 Tax=Streptomyces sp. enrichment culture TaxID=1795815 RepID=UPI003F54C859